MRREESEEFQKKRIVLCVKCGTIDCVEYIQHMPLIDYASFVSADRGEEERARGASRSRIENN